MSQFFFARFSFKKLSGTFQVRDHYFWLLLLSTVACIQSTTLSGCIRLRENKMTKTKKKKKNETEVIATEHKTKKKKRCCFSFLVNHINLKNFKL